MNTKICLNPLNFWMFLLHLNMEKIELGAFRPKGPFGGDYMAVDKDDDTVAGSNDHRHRGIVTPKNFLGTSNDGTDVNQEDYNYHGYEKY